MKDKVWKDCPICGMKNSMEFREGVKFHVGTRKNLVERTVTGLSGFFCTECGEGFFSEESNKRVNDALKLEKEKK
jgi:YgiT-type zinc finger domain-containing protein